MGQTFNIFIKLIKFGDWDLDFVLLQKLPSFQPDYFRGLRSESKIFLLSFLCRQHLWRADNTIDYVLRKYKCRKKEVKFVWSLALTLILFSVLIIATLNVTWTSWFGKIVWLRKEPSEPYQYNCSVRVEGVKYESPLTAVNGKKPIYPEGRLSLLLIESTPEGQAGFV